MFTKPQLFLIFLGIWSGYILNLLMNWSGFTLWQQVLLVIIPATITAIATLYISKKSQLKEITKAINELSERLGDFKNFSLESQIGVIRTGIPLAAQLGVGTDSKSVTGQLGIGKDDKTLTGQHKDILDFLEKTKTVSDEEFRKFNKKQKDIKKTIDEIRFFFEDWEKKTAQINSQDEEIERLKEYIHSLENGGHQEDEEENEHEI